MLNAVRIPHALARLMTGTGYDCFDTQAHTLDPRIQSEQLKNRLSLKYGLEKQGLVNYENDWWHYTFKPETFPDTYFDFPLTGHH